MKISELSLYTHNITAVRDFYGSILSLKSESSDSISFLAGETQLNFKNTSEVKTPFYHFAFNIPSNKIEEAKEWMRGKVELLPISDNNFIADFVNWNAKSIYFIDPAGNIGEFIARFDLKNERSEKFDSTHILNVSEIGIISNDIPKFRQKLAGEFKISDFVKSVNSDSFSAMGDDDGLFILASESRNWYPTNIPSQKSPFEIKFMNDFGQSFVLTDKMV